jgi:Flp pilus assembly protein TadB
MITLVDENDFQWLALGVLGTLLIVLVILVVVLGRRLRRMDRAARRMEQLPEPEVRMRVKRAHGRAAPEWNRYGGPG